MATNAQLILRDDNGIVADLMDGTRYEVAERDGVVFGPLVRRGSGDGTREEDYENRKITIRLRLLDADSYDDLADNLQRLQRLAFEARQYKTFQWGPRVELQMLPGRTLNTSTAGAVGNRPTEPVYWDVLDWEDNLPRNVWGFGHLASGLPARVGSNEDEFYTITLEVKPFARGHEEEFENYLLNPSFERGTAPGESWTDNGGTNVLDVAHKYHGLQSLGITGSADNHGIYQSITLVANRAYVASVWVYVTAGTLEFLIQDATNNADFVSTTQGTTSQAWVRLSLLFVTNSVTSWRFYLIQSGGAALNAWVDCAMLSPCQPVFDMDVRGCWNFENATTGSPMHGHPGAGSTTYNLTAVAAPTLTTAGAVRRQGVDFNGSTQWMWHNNTLTHVFGQASTGGFSGNLNATAAFTYFNGQSPALTGAIHYFGDTRGTFSSSTYHIGTGRGGGTIVWEYWNGAWVALTVTDNTTTFSVTGRNLVSWAVPGDWATTAINTVTAFWVRARVTVDLTTTPTNTNLEIQRSSIHDDLTGSFTICGFFNFDTLVGADTLCSKWAASGGATRASSWRLFLDTDELLKFDYVNTVGATVQTTSIKLINVDRWYFFAFVHDTSNNVDRLWAADLTVDSKVQLWEDADGRTSDMRISSAVFVVGASDGETDPDTDADNPFDGTVDEVTISGAALTEQQLNRILQDSLQKYRTLNGGSETPKAWVGTRAMWEREDTETGVTNRFDFMDVPGDIQAPCDLLVGNGFVDVTQGTFLAGLRTFDADRNFDMFLSESEIDAAGDGVTSVTTTGVTSSGATGGAIDGAFRRISFVSNTGVINRIAWDIAPRNATLSMIGGYEAFTRVRPGASGSARLRLGIGESLLASGTTAFLQIGEIVEATNATMFQLYSLGYFQIPPVARDPYDLGPQTQNFRIWLQIGATASGKGSADVDFVMLLPIEEGAFAARSYSAGGGTPAWGNAAVHISGIQKKAWRREWNAPTAASPGSDLILGSAAVIDYSGEFPSLPTNRSGSFYVTAFGEADFRRFNVRVGTLATATMYVRLRYRPLYGHLLRGD